MRVLVAMSGGVDSSVAAARLVEDGHEVCGATLKLWGGASDSGCCSVGDVDDARRVAQQIGIPHYVFDMTEAFESSVVDHYVAAHAAARTPNPCVECNRHIKFDRLLGRAVRLGFDALATGHHARVVHGTGDRPHELRRGADQDKDQSYVLSMLAQDQLERVVLPIGDLTKAEVRSHAAALGLRTAAKPDSQDVCFIRSDVGRQRFLSERLQWHPATVIDTSTGREAGRVEALEMVTVGQRRGFDHGPDGARRYVSSVDPTSATVFVGRAEDVATKALSLVPGSLTWVDGPIESGSGAIAQVSAHGRPTVCRFVVDDTGPGVGFDEKIRPVAPGQTIALYDLADPEKVLGAGIAR